MIDWLNLHGIKIVITVILGVVLYLLIVFIAPRLLHHAIKGRMKDKLDIEIRKRSKTLSRVLISTFGIIIGLVVLFTILAEVGINIGPALASLGVAGIAIGFGAQSLVKDIINGLFILIENQYGIGDVIKVAGVTGLVEEINLRQTILRDFSGVVHHIPNGEVTIASNLTKEYSRVNMNITVGYGEDLDRVIEVINGVCSTLIEDIEWKDKILKAPQAIRVESLGDSGIDIKVIGDTVPKAQWDVMGELRKRIKREFDLQNIEIPWPHLKVYFGNQQKITPS
jgi:small conductance mechanosensitive channel